MARYYYNQADNRWANKIYSSTGNTSQTIKSSGCGPTSAAMVVSSLKEIVFPDKMAELFVSKGFRTANNGTSWAAFQWIAKNWGLEVSEKYQLDDAINCLKRGSMAIAIVDNGLFSVGGHIIALSYMSGNNIVVYDPYLYSGKFNLYDRSGKVTLEGTKVYCSVNNFKQYANYSRFYCYEPTKPQTNLDTNSSDIIKSLQIALNQSYNSKLVVDGIIGTATTKVLTSHYLKEYTENALAKWVQERLIAKNYNVGAWGADGKYGASTANAIKQFQKNNGLVVDGLTGINTIKKLI